MKELVQVSKSAEIWCWVTLIMGILAVASPLIFGTAVVIMVAIVLVIAGIARVIAGHFIVGESK
jgi:uncharacterized membrane protein HdeD (DUF308 family)